LFPLFPFGRDRLIEENSPFPSSLPALGRRERFLLRAVHLTFPSSKRADRGFFFSLLPLSSLREYKSNHFLCPNLLGTSLLFRARQLISRLDDLLLFPPLIFFFSCLPLDDLLSLSFPCRTLRRRQFLSPSHHAESACTAFPFLCDRDDVMEILLLFSPLFLPSVIVDDDLPYSASFPLFSGSTAG